jgi:hypothetical protein
MATEMIEVPARAGKAVRLSEGWSVKLVNTVGSQVVDTWAFNAHDLAEHMSMEHTRVMLGRSPKVGRSLYSNRRRPLPDDGTLAGRARRGDRRGPVRYRMLGLDQHASCAETWWRRSGAAEGASPCPSVRELPSRGCGGTGGGPAASEGG